MRDITCFSMTTAATFENDNANMLEFNELLLDTSHSIYEKYTKEEANKIIRNQFDAILGGKFSEMSQTKRRQAWREHGKEIATLIEDVLIDKMISGWDETNAAFMEFVEDKSLANGDTNEFYVEDNSLLQVSKYAGNHHDVDLNGLYCFNSIRVA